MPRKVTSQNQHWPFWSRLFSVIMSMATGVLIYWISGGFPPTTWQTLWLVLYQAQTLWRHGALSLVLQLAILGVQGLLLLFVWLICLWIICIELLAFIEHIFEPVLLKSSFLSDLADNLYFAVRAPLRIFSRRQTTSTSNEAESGLALSAASNLTPALGIAERLEHERAASPTISPFAPDYLRWFQQSPEPFSTRVQKMLSGKFPAVSAPGPGKDSSTISNGSSKPLSEEAILQNPFEEPKEDTLQNPFASAKDDLLPNPFEEPEDDTLQNPFESFLAESSDIADKEILVSTNPPSMQNEERNDDASQLTLPDESLVEDSTTTLPNGPHTEDDTPISATSTSALTMSPGQSLLAGYCAQPEETGGDTAHLELCEIRTISAGVQLLSGLYAIVSGSGETGSDNAISSQVIKIMRERLEPLQQGTCSNEELKELFFVTGQHVYERILQKAQQPYGKQKKSYTLTGMLVLQEPSADSVSYTAHVVHCGSSQLYCYSASKGLTRITNEEEVETLLTQQTLATEEEQFSADPSERSIGHTEESTMTKISSFSLPLQPRDRLLLCGSGLWNALLDRELSAFLALPMRNPMQIATLLQQAAIEANYQKQIMATVVFIHE